MGQRWCTGREPDVHLRKVHGKKQWVLRLVYCNTDRFKYPTKDDHRKVCKKYGGEASFKRCLACPSNEGIAYELHGTHRGRWYPLVCIPQDFSFNPRRRVCRECSQRLECISRMLERGATIKPVVIRKKKPNGKIVFRLRVVR